MPANYTTIQLCQILLDFRHSITGMHKIYNNVIFEDPIVCTSNLRYATL